MKQALLEIARRTAWGNKRKDSTGNSPWFGKFGEKGAFVQAPDDRRPCCQRKTGWSLFVHAKTPLHCAHLFDLDPPEVKRVWRQGQATYLSQVAPSLATAEEDEQQEKAPPSGYLNRAHAAIQAELDGCREALLSEVMGLDARVHELLRRLRAKEEEADGGLRQALEETTHSVCELLQQEEQLVTFAKGPGVP